jgi:putative addiction module component (TIGR02574 family)
MKAAPVMNFNARSKPQLVENLWDDLASTPESVPVHDWQREELLRRQANLKAHPGSAWPWREVRLRIRQR